MSGERNEEMEREGRGRETMRQEEREYQGNQTVMQRISVFRMLCVMVCFILGKKIELRLIILATLVFAPWKHNLH